MQCVVAIIRIIAHSVAIIARISRINRIATIIDDLSEFLKISRVVLFLKLGMLKIVKM